MRQSTSTFDRGCELGNSAEMSGVREINRGEKPHICVCVCTYKRPGLLKQLLAELAAQETAGLFTYSVLIADNDHQESARGVVSDFAAQSAIPITYCVEPRQNIALARNRAVENAQGDFIAFFDDDQLPAQKWLLTLFKNCNEHGVDGVLGPVKPRFEQEPPQWVVRGKFYERATYKTGFVIDWPKGRTGNVLLKKRVLSNVNPAFRPEFLSGEDQDFFRRAIEKGYVFVWCNEAIAYEFVPPLRWKRTFMIRRALLRGASAALHPTSRPLNTGKSLIAIAVYVTALPFALVLGQHRFMPLLIRFFDHLGKLLALLGLNPIKKAYITE